MLPAKLSFSVLLFFFLAWPAGALPVQGLQDAPLKISEPRSGGALQGVVLVHGTTDLPGFRLAEVAFGYQDDPTGTWFVIEQSTAPVREDLIARWDTSTITDGEYQLRVRVEYGGGQAAEALVTHLRVRNYSPVETSTPDAARQRTVEPTVTPLPDYRPAGEAPAPLPTNPAQVTVEHLQSSALRGAAYALAVFAALGIYWVIRRAARRW